MLEHVQTVLDQGRESTRPPSTSILADGAEGEDTWGLDKEADDELDDVEEQGPSKSARFSQRMRNLALKVTECLEADDAAKFRYINTQLNANVRRHTRYGFVDQMPNFCLILIAIQHAAVGGYASMILPLFAFLYARLHRPRVSLTFWNIVVGYMMVYIIAVMFVSLPMFVPNVGNSDATSPGTCAISWRRLHCEHVSAAKTGLNEKTLMLHGSLMYENSTTFCDANPEKCYTCDQPYLEVDTSSGAGTESSKPYLEGPMLLGIAKRDKTDQFCLLFFGVVIISFIGALKDILRHSGQHLDVYQEQTHAVYNGMKRLHELYLSSFEGGKAYQAIKQSFDGNTDSQSDAFNTSNRSWFGEIQRTLSSSQRLHMMSSEEFQSVRDEARRDFMSPLSAHLSQLIEFEFKSQMCKMLDCLAGAPESWKLQYAVLLDVCNTLLSTHKGDCACKHGLEQKECLQCSQNVDLSLVFCHAKHIIPESGYMELISVLAKEANALIQHLAASDKVGDVVNLFSFIFVPL